MNSSNDIRDIKGVVAVPLEWWVWALVGLGVVVAAMLVWWLRRKKPVAAPPPVRVLTPREIAQAALEKLRQDQPEVEVFYTRLSGIVRQFIEGEFGLRAPERTTEEFLAEAKLPPEQMELLGVFLQESDLVKFARHRPGQEDMARAFTAAEQFVERASSSFIVGEGTGKMPVLRA